MTGSIIPSPLGEGGLIIANDNLIFQNEEKEKRAAELISISGNGRKSLAFRRSL